SNKRAGTERHLPASEAFPANAATLASILSALERIEATVTHMKGTQLSIIDTQRHLSNQVQILQNRDKRFYTRLQHIPHEIIVQIFAWLHVGKVFKYRRLSKTINEALLSNQFAVLNMHMPDFQNGSIDTIGGLWLMLPPPYQAAVARALGSQAKRVFRFNGRNFKKTLPESIKYLTAVEEISLFTLEVSGTIPDAFYGLNNLTNLNLESNYLTGVLPRSFGMLTGLINLNLTNNKLRGEFPALPNSSLETLCISYNKFTGPIPTLFGNPHKLKKIRARNNLFKSIPAAIGQFSNLEVLCISKNRISSEIPSQIWNLRALESLEMASCKMFGSLAGVGALRNLKVLDVFNNQLCGTLPAREISSMRTLRSLHLSQNQFSGQVGERLDIPELGSMCADPDVPTNCELESESELDCDSESADSESQIDSMVD
ncbi:hypothetical protein HDU80_009260, partial [Chytriomyces hyalinus]